MQVNITNESIIKTGPSQRGGNWTLYKYEMEDGRHFTTFEKHNLGVQDVNLVEEINGQYKNLKEVKDVRPNSQTKMILDEIAKLNTRFNELAKFLTNK